MTADAPVQTSPKCVFFSGTIPIFFSGTRLVQTFSKRACSGAREIETSSKSVCSESCLLPYKLLQNVFVTGLDQYKRLLNLIVAGRDCVCTRTTQLLNVA